MSLTALCHYGMATPVGHQRLLRQLVGLRERKSHGMVCVRTQWDARSCCSDQIAACLRWRGTSVRAFATVLALDVSLAAVSRSADSSSSSFRNRWYLLGQWGGIGTPL